MCVCVLFLQTVIVIPLAQTVIAVMTQDFVSVRREPQGLSVTNVCRDICGTMAANVSRTSNIHQHLQPASISSSLPPSLPLQLLAPYAGCLCCPCLLLSLSLSRSTFSLSLCSLFLDSLTFLLSTLHSTVSLFLSPCISVALLIRDRATTAGRSH